MSNDRIEPCVVLDLRQVSVLLDGNKRVAWECLDLTLETNGYRLTSSHEENFKLITRVIERAATVQDIADWLKKQTRRIP